MKTKAEIVENWLPRYTQHPLSDFGEYILLTNFNNYVDIFCEQLRLPQPGYGANMRMATAENITIINFGMGSPNAAIMPALPAFMLQRAVSTAIRDAHRDYWTGTVYTTNRRIWEHDEKFKEYLKDTRAMAVDMETATLFTCGFANHIPTGALLLVSDNPMMPEGVKTAESDREVTHNFAPEHVTIGIEALKLIIGERKTVEDLKYDW